MSQTTEHNTVVVYIEIDIAILSKATRTEIEKMRFFLKNVSILFFEKNNFTYFSGLSFKYLIFS